MSTPRVAFKYYAAGLALAVASAFALTAQAAGPYAGGPGYGPMMTGPGGHGGHGGHGAMMGGAGGYGPMMGGPGMHGARMGGPGAGMSMSEPMLDRINASPEQRTQLRKIAQDAAADMHAQREAGRAMRDQMAQLFNQPTIDARAVEALRQQMLAHHDQASKRRTQAMLDGSAVLTAEQRKLIADTGKQRREMMERHRRERQALDAPKS